MLVLLDRCWFLVDFSFWSFLIFLLFHFYFFCYVILNFFRWSLVCCSPFSLRYGYIFVTAFMFIQLCLYVSAFLCTHMYAYSFARVCCVFERVCLCFCVRVRVNYIVRSSLYLCGCFHCIWIFGEFNYLNLYYLILLSSLTILSVFYLCLVVWNNSCFFCILFVYV